MIELQKKCIREQFNVILLKGCDNFLINYATKNNHLALLLEFPDRHDIKENERVETLINIIYDYLSSINKNYLS